jgi:plasmid stability protein
VVAFCNHDWHDISMATLHVRNVPDELYERLKESAEAKRRSLSTQVIVLLNEALAPPKPSQAELLERLRRLRSSVVLPPNVPDSTVLLREDRER